MKKVDWSVYVLDFFLGGWGFLDVNMTILDIDDIIVVLRVLVWSRGNENVDIVWKWVVNWVKGL